jgi:hypothetical protein
MTKVGAAGGQAGQPGVSQVAACQVHPPKNRASRGRSECGNLFV